MDCSEPFYGVQNPEILRDTNDLELRMNVAAALGFSGSVFTWDFLLREIIEVTALANRSYVLFSASDASSNSNK